MTRPGGSPATRDLEEALRAALAAEGRPADGLTLLHRERSPYTSTFPCERVRCRVGEETLDIWCKFGGEPKDPTYGHKGGVPREAEIYRRVLKRFPCGAPLYLGSWNTGRGDTWLFLRHLPDALRMGSAPQPQAMTASARWLGRFHRAGEKPRWFDEECLPRHDADYLQAWPRRTREFSAPLQARLPWLAGLCHRAETTLLELLEAPQGVVHGEFYSRNILWGAGEVHPVDWEAAAVGAPELDLASLTERWPEEVATLAEEAYREARWPEGAPPSFSRRLTVARLYWHLRWLGDRPEWTVEASSAWRYPALERVARDLDLIGP